MSPKELQAYNEFKTGFTFRDVFSMVWSQSEDYRDWPKSPTKVKYVPGKKKDYIKKCSRRHTVLRKWREIKLEMWEETKYRCMLDFEG